jgi:hypothetical protein
MEDVCVTRNAHVLRPHHIFLLYVMMYTYPEPQRLKLPPPFLLNIHRFLLHHISEVN